MLCMNEYNFFVYILAISKSKAEKIDTISNWESSVTFPKDLTYEGYRNLVPSDCCSYFDQLFEFGIILRWLRCMKNFTLEPFEYI